jgi:hypothetical protein
MASARLLALGRKVEERHSTPSLGEVLDGMGPAGLGLTLLLLTLPSLIPLPGPFGMVFGTVIGFVSLQVLVGSRRLWLPEVIRRRPVSKDVFATLVAKGVPMLERLEAWLKPRRLLPLTGRLARIGLAMPLFVMAVTLALPIPLGNLMPAASLIAFALGFMTRDGYAVLAGLVLSVLALVWTGFLIVFGAQLVAWFWSLIGWG